MLIFGGTAKAEEALGSLLHKLGKEEALYKKTVDESAGLLLLYTREDLDRLQLRNLKDLLKSVRFVSYEEGVLGEAILVPTGSYHPLSAMFRLYIDGHEVSSPIFGSAMYQFAEMDLGFADHVEIYQGGNAIAFGNEPGMMTIRIYSRDPRREGGSTAATRGDSKGGAFGSLNLNAVDENASRLGYLSLERTPRKTTAGGRIYSKDRETLTAYGKYERNRFRFVAAHFQNRKDAFAGIGLRLTPKDPNDIAWRHSFINLSWNPTPHSTLELSADYSRHRLRFTDTSGIRLLSAPIAFTRFDGEYGERVYKGSLRGVLPHDRGELRWGAEGIVKSYRIFRNRYDNLSLDDPKGPDRLTILSAYMEESWHLTPSDLLIGTFKFDHLYDNFRRRDDEHSLRVGWIHLFSLRSSFKLFYNQTYLYPGFGYTSTYPKYAHANPLLGAEHYQNIVAEWSYADGDHHLKTGAIWQRVGDRIAIHPVTQSFYNLDETIEAGKFYLNYGYSFSPDHRIELEYYRGWSLEHRKELSPLSGGYLRLFNTFGSWEIAQELIYREGYSFAHPYRSGTPPITVPDGWDYSVALQWHPRHDLTISLKGENLLDKALKSPVDGLGAVNVFERKITLGLEYFF